MELIFLLGLLLVIIFSVILQLFLKCPYAVAAVVAVISLIIYAFLATTLTTIFIVWIIVYTLTALFVAYITGKFLQNNRHHKHDEDCF